MSRLCIILITLSVHLQFVLCSAVETARIIGFTVGGVLLLILIVVTAAVCYRRNRCFHGRQPDPQIPPQQSVPKQSPLHSRSTLYETNQREQGLDLTWKKGSEISVEEQCTICLQGQTNIKTKCRHFFHFRCLKQWVVKNKATCPDCRSSNVEPIKLYCYRCRRRYLEYQIMQVTKDIRKAAKRGCKSCIYQRNEQKRLKHASSNPLNKQNTLMNSRRSIGTM